MKQFIRDFMSNDSTFGRIMTRFAIMIGANLMFILFAMPVVTIGPGFVALSYVMLKTLHGDGVLNPFTTFWKGFKMNIRQSIVCFIIFLALAAFLVVDIRFCMHQGGVLTAFKYGLYVVAAALAIITVYLIPVMAAFEDTIPHLLRNAVFFAARRPLKVPLALAIYAVPIAVTILDEKMRPLYGFLWVVIMGGLITMMQAELMINDIEEFLPKDEEEEEEENPDGNKQEISQRKTLKEQKKLEG